VVFPVEVYEHPDTPAGSFAVVSLHQEIITLQHGTEMVGYYLQISGDLYKSVKILLLQLNCILSHFLFVVNSKNRFKLNSDV
jgi:hypothetical protein